MESRGSLDQEVTKANCTDSVLPTTSDASVHSSGADVDNGGDDASRSSGGHSSEYDDSNGGSDDESGGNDSSDGDSDSESEEEDDEEVGGISSLQLRRQQNIQRQMELREKLFGNMISLKKNVGESGRGRKRKQPSSGDVNLNGDAAEYPAVASKPKKRGILLTSEVEAYQEHLKFQSTLDTKASSLGTTDNSGKNHHPSLPPLLIYQELDKKYPHRSFQIQQLTSILDMNVQKTKMAWNMTENTKSFRNQSNYCDNIFSEASYQGNIKMPSPTPIMITGAGGCGKTSIVRDTVRMIRRRANDETSFDSVSDGLDSHAGDSGKYRAEKGTKSIEPIVAEAYVDCASGDSGSVSLVLNNAFRQLHQCFYPKEEEDDSERGQMRNLLANGISTSKDNQTESKKTMAELQEEDDNGDNDVMVGGLGSDIDESDEGNASDIEEDLERMRKTHFRKRLNKKLHRASTPSAYARKAQLSPVTNTRQTRHSLAAGAKQEKLNGNESFSGFKGSASDTAGNSKESSPVAFFGRAVSTLLQKGQSGGTSPSSSASCRQMSNGRCAILILDNAERIMSWRQQGSKNALLQIMRLPSLMGLNLTLILITRSAVLQYSRVCHHVYMCSSNPTTVSELVRPINIHFEAYAGIDAIKTVLNVPHMKFSITGLESSSKELPCIPYIYLRSKLHDLLYNSMLSMFLPSIERRTRDLCEISRLARILWKEYVSPLESKEHTNVDQSINFLTKQIFVSIYRERRSSMKTCSSNCNFCQHLSSKSESNPDETEFSTLKTQLIGKLDQQARESMRILLSTCVVMPGRVIRKQHGVPYVERLPYITKFLLLAAFLCQNKRPQQDANLYTSKNTGKSRKKVDNSTSGAAYATTSSELKQITGRKPTFPLERMLSIFTSIMGQYGTILSRRDDGAPAVAHLGTEILFRAVSQLRATGLLKVTGKNGSGDNPLELMHAKFSCTLSREDAKVIAASVDFPLETYCA